MNTFKVAAAEGKYSPEHHKKKGVRSPLILAIGTTF